jgi:transposase
MLQMDHITKLLDLDSTVIRDVEMTPDTIFLYLERERKLHYCPVCGALTDRIHDYRTQKVKDLPLHGKGVVWVYRKRRYRCECCGKRFYEENPLLPRRHRITNRTALYSMVLLQKKQSRKDIAEDLHVSESTITRWLRLSEYGKPAKLPEVVSIDEFKGNTNSRKFHGILTDPVRKKVLDITESNSEYALYQYLKSFPNRKDVKYFVSDMRKEYVSMARNLFPNAVIVIDRFHVARYNTWAFENVRKNVQKELSPEFRKYFKNSRRLLLKRQEELTPEGKEKVIRMLQIDPKLGKAYLLKEKFYAFMDSEDSNIARKRLKEFLLHAAAADLSEYESCITMLTNWHRYILNAFDCTYSNGFTEGCNNTIKVIKRTGYGYRNFDNFRNRILMVMN